MCVDVGSTYTKALKVSLRDGGIVARTEVPTTSGSDVLHGLDAAVAAVGGAQGSILRVCSSAGGGLRLAVLGYEALVTAEAGHRVGLSAGAQVVHVAAGPASLAEVRRARPDVILLVGGTDGGDESAIRENAARLARARVRIPVVVAGNGDVRDDLVAALGAAGVPVTGAANVLPRIGVLAPEPARSAIREVFLHHVIGGKRLSRGRRFASLVQAPTPDAVLAGVDVLADTTTSGVLVVDVGGATTDVYSALVPDAELSTGPQRDVAGTLWRSRTVEGDLGVGVGAPGVVAAARTEKLPPITLPAPASPAPPASSPPPPARTFPTSPPGRIYPVEVERQLATTAAVIALRRHARGHSPGPGAPRTGGRDLRDVRLVVGSGGVLRHGGGEQVLDAVLRDVAGGWAIPTAARTLVDAQYVLAAAGLLAHDHPDVARALVRGLIDG